MSALSFIVNMVNRLEGRMTPREAWERDLIPPNSPRHSSAGELVTDETALTVTAVFGAVRIISEALATFNPSAIRERDGGVTPLPVQPRWLYTPNVSLRLSWIDVISQVAISLLLTGNAYIATARDPLGQVVALEVLNPRQITPERTKEGSIIYKANGVEGTYTVMDVLHIKGMTKPGCLEGLDPISYAAEAIGTAVAAQKYGGAHFANGAMPGAVIEVPGTMSEVGVRIMRRTWEALHGGTSNAGKVGVLTEGAKFTTVTLTPEQSQFLETRRFSVAEVARLFGVPPHLLMDASGSTSWGSGLSEQSTNYVQHTLRPWVERLEWAFTWLLRSEGRQPTVFVRLDLTDLQRGSFSEQVETYTLGLDKGIFTPNEVRGFLKLPPIPGGDSLRKPTAIQRPKPASLPRPSAQPSADTPQEDPAA